MTILHLFPLFSHFWPTLLLSIVLFGNGFYASLWPLSFFFFTQYLLWSQSFKLFFSRTKFRSYSTCWQQTLSYNFFWDFMSLGRIWWFWVWCFIWFVFSRMCGSLLNCAIHFKQYCGAGFLLHMYYNVYVAWDIRNDCLYYMEILSYISFL